MKGIYAVNEGPRPPLQRPGHDLKVGGRVETDDGAVRVGEHTRTDEEYDNGEGYDADEQEPRAGAPLQTTAQRMPASPPSCPLGVRRGEEYVHFAGNITDGNGSGALAAALLQRGSSEACVSDGSAHRVPRIRSPAEK